MASEAHFRAFMHDVVNRTNISKLIAILELLNEEYFSPEEIAEIQEMSASDEWTNWRDIQR